MFWNRKNSIEKERETQLIVIQLQKLIRKAMSNAQNAISGFDAWVENKYKSQTKEDPSVLSALIGLGDTRRYVAQNKDVLLEFENILNSKQLQLPVVIFKKIKSLKSLNDDIDIELSVFNRPLLEREKGDKVAFFATMVSFDKGMKSRLENFHEGLDNLQELLKLHFLYKSFDYVNAERLEELRSIRSDKFDLSKLICLCEELNSNFQNRNYLSVSMLLRATLDHVPTIFGYKTFIEVSNNYGGKSLKKTLQNLQNSSRNISDAYLHETIKQKESLPNGTQIDFRNDLDVLLGEIVRILK